MMRHRFSVLVLLVALAAYSSASFAQIPSPRLHLLDISVLQQTRARIQEREQSLLPAYKKLVKEADKILKRQCVSIMEKDQTPPSGSKHDYMSLARYYWPDPSKPDGLPYVNRDGETNPAIDEIPDNLNLGRLTSEAWSLSVAYYFTGNAAYAERVSKALRIWFLDTATAMRPNLNYAQFIRGKGDGRPSGIIDARNLYCIGETIALIAPSGTWTSADQQAMVGWFKEYLRWLRTHPNGVKESVSANNHGVWYDVQVVAAACFVGDYALARSVLEKAKTGRIAAQIEPDGSMPRELARTRSKHYAMFNLEAFTLLASYGRALGVDLWHYQTSDGRSIRKALDWVLPYINGERDWTWKEIAGAQWNEFYTVYIRASAAFPDGGYASAAESIQSEKSPSDIVHLLTGH